MPTVLDVIEASLDVHSQSGDEVLCMCPWHSGNEPHLYVNVRKGTYFCQSCGASGGRKRLFEELGYTGGVTVSPEALRSRWRRLLEDEGMDEAGTLPEAVLEPFKVIPTDYWAGRGLSAQTIADLELGYDLATHSGTIPVRQPDGGLLGIVRRRLDPDARPRYLYPKGMAISRILYGAHLVRGREVAVTEGSMDAAALREVGIEACALLGARLSRWQQKILLDLAPRSVVVFTDDDNAGINAALTIGRALNRHVPVRVVDYEAIEGTLGKDPGELTPEQRRDLYEAALPFRHYAAMFVDA